MSSHRWEHRAAFTSFKGKTKVYCGCGKQSPVFRDPQEANEWHVRHTGLVEQMAKRQK